MDPVTSIVNVVGSLVGGASGAFLGGGAIVAITNFFNGNRQREFQKVENENSGNSSGKCKIAKWSFNWR